MFMKVQVASMWKKKIDTKDSRIWAHDSDGLVHYTNHETTEDFLDRSEII